MSYIDASTSERIARVTREVLESSRFARSRAPANVTQAARFATEELARRVRAGTAGPRQTKEARARGWDADDGRTIEANRRLLHRLGYEWSEGRRLQSDAYITVRALLRMIDSGSSAKLDAVTVDPAAATRWRTAISKGELLGVAKPEERQAFEFEPSGKADSAFAHIVQQHAARLLPVAPLPRWVFREIERFRSWARRRGHSEARIEVSLQRFWIPFCAHGRTLGVERGWHDLTTDERKRAVIGSLNVERAWLGKESADQRLMGSAQPAEPEADD